MNELKHYGVLGMKWGRRKGSSSSSGSKTKKRGASKKKSISELSNEELKARINRMQMEDQYSSLKKKQSTIHKGSEAVKHAAVPLTLAAAVTTAGITLYNNSQKIKELFSK